MVLVVRDPALLCTVAETATALFYRLECVLSYIPCISKEMIPALEAPWSYLAGVPACLVPLVDPLVWDNVVGFDLDQSRFNGLESRGHASHPH